MSKFGIRGPYSVTYRKQFYNELAIEMGTIDVKQAQFFYHSLIKLIKRKLKTTRYIDLPNIVELQVYDHPGKAFIDINTRERKIQPPHKTLKIRVSHALRSEVKEYFDGVVSLH